MKFFQYLHAVERGGKFGTDGGVAVQLFAADDFGRPGGVSGFHHFECGVVSQEIAALHECHGMGVDFLEVVPIVFGEAKQAVRDAQFVFPHDGQPAVAKQLIVV